MLSQLARFSSVVPLVEELGSGELLDVGSGSEGVASWVGPGWDVTAVDRGFEEAVALPGPRGGTARTVVGDARALPFEDGAFDVVLALDVLEHIAPQDRRQVVGELVRTTRRRLIVAGPTGVAALAVDRGLGDRLRARGMEPPEWLAEHEQNGLPERGELIEQLRPCGRLSVLLDENLRWHGLVMRFESRRPGFNASRAGARLVVGGLAAGGARRALARAALRIVRGPRRGRAYRTVAVLDRGRDAV